MVFWWILVGWKNWNMTIYVHLCCSMGDILIIQNKIVGWKLEKCSCMLQYGWYFDNSKDFGGVKIWNMSIYVYLCCSMGDMLIIQRILVGWQFEKCPFMSIYAAIWVIFWKFKRKLVGWKIEKCPFMLQYGWYVDNSNGEKTNEHEMVAYSKWSCVRVQLHNWKNAYSKWTGYIIIVSKFIEKNSKFSPGFHRWKF